jgi:hypothetical protein
MTRRAPNKDERIAAALLHIKRGDEWLIPEPLRSSGDAKAICQHVEWHHNVHHAMGGTTAPQNMIPLSKEAHAVQTRKVDIPRIAKMKRIMKKEEEFRAKMLVKVGQGETIEAAKAKRKYVWPKRKMQSRNSFQKRVK